MLTLKEAFEFLQEDYTLEVCEAAFPRLRKLARAGRINESIFQAVAFATKKRLSKPAPIRVAGTHQQLAGRLGGQRSAELAATGARMSMSERARVRWGS